MRIEFKKGGWVVISRPSLWQTAAAGVSSVCF